MLSSFGLSCSRLNVIRLCTHVPWSLFLSFSKIFILSYYRDLKRIFRSPRSVIVDHCRSFLVLVTRKVLNLDQFSSSYRSVLSTLSAILTADGRNGSVAENDNHSPARSSNFFHWVPCPIWRTHNTTSIHKMKHNMGTQNRIQKFRKSPNLGWSA